MKPEPFNKHVVCSVCGLDWVKHCADPSLEECVRLLKAEVQRLTILHRPRGNSQRGGLLDVIPASGAVIRPSGMTITQGPF